MAGTATPPGVKNGWFLALALGGIGFAVNGFSLAGGWGLDFVLGSAVVFSALRVLTPMQIVIAGSLSASRTIWAWEHPWAWLVWTVEAAVLASMSKQTSPVRRDVLFWILGGAPLLWLTYGQLMEMDGSSLVLLILKHSINGVLNVTLGELAYSGLLIVAGQRARRRLPPVSIDSAILALMISVATVPAVLWLRIDAPHRESWLRSLAETHLTEGYQETERRLWAWRDERTAALASYLTAEQGASPAVPALNRDFTSALVMERAGSWLRPAGSSAAAGPTVFGPLPSETMREPHLLAQRTAAAATTPGAARLALVAPLPQTAASGQPDNRFAAGILRPDVIDALIRPESDDPGFTGLLLIGPSGQIGAHYGNASEPWLVAAAAQAFPDGRTVETAAPRQFGTPPMNASRDVVFLTARPTRAFPGWKVVLVSHARGVILEERLAQLRVFAGLAGLVVLLTILATILARRSRNLLDRMAQSLADLAVQGGRPEELRRALIAEMEEISTRISIASSKMQEQRQALLVNRRRLEVIIEHGGLVIYTVDTRDPARPDLKFITGNVAELLGYGPGDVSMEEFLRDYLHPEDQAAPPLARPAFAPGEVIVSEYRIRHRDGHFVWVHDCLVIDESEDGAMEGVGFLIDITERKASAEKLIQASKMESLGRMAAGVAHELNQPLNFISLASQNLYKRFSTGNVDSPYAMDKIERILSQVRRAALIVGQVRTFGRSATEASDIIEVADVVSDVASLLKGQLDLKGVSLKCAPVSPALRVRIHPVRLGQVLINLVINARDSILERMETDETPATIEVSTCECFGWVEIVVEDTGTGIPPDKLALLFEPFFTTKSPKEGTGLGLSVSYGIIAEAGGMIRAENAENGARFVVRLPSQTTAAAA